MYNFESQSFLLIYIESSFNDKSTDKSKKKENKYTDIISSNNNNINEKLERFVVWLILEFIWIPTQLL